ncbi:MAG TPA: hypothetical protein VIK33_17545 [Anaerolineae bacterium]
MPFVFLLAGNIMLAYLAIRGATTFILGPIITLLYCWQIELHHGPHCISSPLLWPLIAATVILELSAIWFIVRFFRSWRKYLKPAK